MTSLARATSSDQAIETMISLARLATSHPIIVAGADSLQLHRDLHRRGYLRSATASGLYTRRGQYCAALIAGDRTHQAIEASIVSVSRFLGAKATIVVAIQSDEKGIGLKVRSRLEQFGFRIEAGVRCPSAFLLSAYRRNYDSVGKAA